MPFVKLDTGLLKSTIWRDPVAFRIFMAALVSAEPREYTEPEQVIKVRSLDDDSYKLPPGWYGFASVSGPYLVNEACGDPKAEEGWRALEWVCSPESESRTLELGGRRLARVNGGYVVINYMKYRDIDYNAKDRMRRLRERRKAQGVRPNGDGVTVNGRNVHPNVTHSREQRAEDVPLFPDATPERVIDSRDAHAPRAKSNSWTEQACDDWIERHGGTAPGGPIGRHLRVLVEKHTWEVVRPAWRAYLAETEAQYANPSRFAATFGSWNRAPVATAPPPEVPERPSQEADAADFMQKVVLLLKETTPLQNWATWIRPIRGWAWLDSGSVLEIAAPSPEHAEKLRGLYREKLRAAASQLGKTLKFKVFVLQWEPPTVHNGSIR